MDVIIEVSCNVFKYVDDNSKSTFSVSKVLSGVVSIADVVVALEIVTSAVVNSIGGVNVLFVESTECIVLVDVVKSLVVVPVGVARSPVVVAECPVLVSKCIVNVSESPVVDAKPPFVVSKCTVVSESVDFFEYTAVVSE